MAEGKTVTVTIATLAQAVGPKGKYYVLTTVPRTGRQYGDKYQLNVNQVEGLEAGAVVTLQLKQGRLKEGKSGDKEWDYWWDVETLTKGAVETPKPEPEKKPNGAPEKGEPQPWHRYIAWGEIVQQARLMVLDTSRFGADAEKDPPPPEMLLETYATRFNWAMDVICRAIREQMDTTEV